MGRGYRLAYHNTVVSNLCFMDDVTVFTKDSQELDNMLKVIDKVSQATGIKLALGSVLLHTLSEASWWN